MVKETILKNAGEGYVSPAVEVIEVEIEQGFATSGSINDVPMHGASYYDDETWP